MFLSRSTVAPRAAATILAGALLFSTAAAASERYQQIFPQGAQPGPHHNAQALYPYGGGPTFTTPNDFVSSHVCINGYRYITRDLDRWESPAQNAIPVRC